MEKSSWQATAVILGRASPTHLWSSTTKDVRMSASFHRLNAETRKRWETHYGMIVEN